MVAGGVPIWSVAPIWSESWMGEDGGGWGAATSSVLASTPNVTPDSPHRESVAHTRGIAKAVSGRERWKCFRLIVSHLNCILITRNRNKAVKLYLNTNLQSEKLADLIIQNTG